MVISNPESVEKVSRPAWDLTLEKQNTIDNLKEIKSPLRRKIEMSDINGDPLLWRQIATTAGLSYWLFEIILSSLYAHNGRVLPFAINYHRQLTSLSFHWFRAIYFHSIQ